MKKTCLLFLLLIISCYSFSQFSWTRHPDNPVMNAAPGEWDEQFIAPTTILFYDDIYHMYYGGGLDYATGFGYATSPDGINWTRYENNPILTLGAEGEWDAVRIADCMVVRRDTIIHMWYSAYGENFALYRIGHATSPDGLNWTKDPDNPIMDIVEGDPEKTTTILNMIFYNGNLFHMYYSTCIRHVTKMSVNHAISEDGYNWTLVPGNPIMQAVDKDAYRSAESIAYNGDQYIMSFLSGQQWEWVFNIAVSDDLYSWEQYAHNPTFFPGPTGSWDSIIGRGTIMYDSTIDRYKMWYLGGDLSISGIGYAESVPWEGLICDLMIQVPQLVLEVDSTIMFGARLLPDFYPDRSVPWTSSNQEVATVSSEGVVTGVSLGEVTIAATADSGRCSDSCIVTVVDHIPEFTVQVIDSYTMEILSGCNVYLNGRLFVKDFVDGLNLSGWAYDTCSIQITRSGYVDFDTTVVVKTDTTLLINLKYASPEAELFVYSEPLLEKADFLEMMMTQHGIIYLTPEGTPVVEDSIKEYAIASYHVSAGDKTGESLYFIPPGIYRIFGISNVGRMATESYVVQVIDHFPECVIQVRDAVSNELVDSCLLVVRCPMMSDGQDTIPGNIGEYDMTGLVYDTCFINITREGYGNFDTTLVVLSDTTFTLYLTSSTALIDQLARQVRIFPNPTSKFLSIEASTSNHYSIEITSLNGQRLYSKVMNGSRHQFDLSSLQNGIYVMTVRSGDFVITRKIIKL
jgi:predicted GH43/DUF377 family glycosyl hydrolase